MSAIEKAQIKEQLRKLTEEMQKNTLSKAKAEAQLARTQLPNVVCFAHGGVWWLCWWVGVCVWGGGV